MGNKREGKKITKITTGVPTKMAHYYFSENSMAINVTIPKEKLPPLYLSNRYLHRRKVSQIVISKKLNILSEVPKPH